MTHVIMIIYCILFFTHYNIQHLTFYLAEFFWRSGVAVRSLGMSRQRLKNMGLRRQAASHLQQPRGPAEVSRLLSVSEARVWSVDMEEMSLTEEDGGRLSLLFTAAPVLRKAAKKRLQRKRERKRHSASEHRERGRSYDMWRLQPTLPVEPMLLKPS